MVLESLTTLCYIEHNGKCLMLHRTKKINDINEDKWNTEYKGGYLQ